MNCPHGHGPLVAVGKFLICGQCGFQHRQGAPASEESLAIPNSLAALPSILAIPLAEYFAEVHSVLKLHRLCDAVEIVTRFLTIVALGELRARLEGNPLPAALLDKLQPFIERPTFGAWRELLRTVCESLDHAATLVVSALPQFVVKDLLPALSADPRTPETNLIELRNRSVHGGALTTADAQLYLAIWSPWLSSLAERLAFFNNVEVCHYAAGRASRLIGPNARASELALRPELIQVFAALGLDGHVLMLHSGRFLDLWPLCDYGRASSTSLAGNRTSKADAPLVFYRADRDRLLYAALGVDLSQGERPDAVAEFRDLFQLDARQPDLRSVAVTDY